jgi:aspartate aminotransferase
MNGVSKAYCMTGWRIGYAAGPEKLIKAMAKMQSQSTSNPSSISAGRRGRGAERPAGLHRRATTCLQGAPRPRGADAEPGPGHLLPEARRAPSTSTRPAPARSARRRRRQEDQDDEDFVTALLEEEGVAVVQGAAFGLSPYFRISYATATETLRDACQRIVRFCE